MEHSHFEVSIAPGPRHWDLFVRLCRDANAKGPLVPDAYLAALAIESGSEITTDRDFARFPGLRWRHVTTFLQNVDLWRSTLDRLDLKITPVGLKYCTKEPHGLERLGRARVG